MSRRQKPASATVPWRSSGGRRSASVSAARSVSSGRSARARSSSSSGVTSWVAIVNASSVLDVDLESGALLEGGAEHQHGGRGVLHGHADGFVEGQLLGGRAAGPATVEQLADLDDLVGIRGREVGGARGHRREGGGARFDGDQ